MEAAKVCSGGSTVPAAVVIVVKHRACLSVGRLIVGVQARSFAQAVGVTAQSLSGLFRRRISTVSCHSGRRHIDTTVAWFVAAADTGRFERVEDGKYVGVIGACWRCRRVLAL